MKLYNKLGYGTGPIKSIVMGPVPRYEGPVPFGWDRSSQNTFIYSYQERPLLGLVGFTCSWCWWLDSQGMKMTV